MKRIAPFVVVIALGALLRLYLLTDKSIWIDEIQHITWAKGHAVSGFSDVRARELGVRLPPRDASDALREIRKHVPFVSDTILNLWMRVVGSDSDFALKLLFALFGTASILGVILLALDLFGRRAAIAAGLLVACSPFHVYYAQEVNHYAPALCWVVFSYVFYFRFLRNGRTRDGAALALFGTLALYSHYYAALVVLSQGIGILIYHGRQFKAVVRAAAPLAASVILFGIDIRNVKAQLFGHADAGFGGAFGGFDFFFERLLANTLHPWVGELANAGITMWLGLPLLGVVAALFVMGLRAHEERRLRSILAVNALLPLAIIFAAYGVMRNNQLLWPRYVIFFSFTLFVVVAAFFGTNAFRARHVAAAIVLAVAMGAGLNHYYHRFKKRDWRAAAQAIATHADARDAVIVHVPNVVFALARYLSTDQRLFGVSEADLLNGTFERATADRPGVWTAFAWATGRAEPLAIRKKLSCRFNFRDDFAAYGIELSRYHNGETRTARSIEHRACGAQNGFVSGPSACVWEGDTTANKRVLGWVDVPHGALGIKIRFPHRKELIEVASIAAPTVADPLLPEPAPSTTRRWFEVLADLSGSPAGHFVRGSVVLTREGGAILETREDLVCLKRHDVSRNGVGGAFVAKGVVDHPASDLSVNLGDRMEVAGWAFSSTGIRELVIKVDGREVARTRRHGSERGDVAAAFPAIPKDLATYSGFSEMIGTGNLAPGRHELTVEWTSSDGKAAPIGTPRAFFVFPRAPDRPKN